MKKIKDKQIDREIIKSVDKKKRKKVTRNNMFKAKNQAENKEKEKKKKGFMFYVLC